ncbi:glucose 1-dehydrogenase [Aurantimonas sp. C2-5-R2]|uniref:SDR family NAD(P)-dependent oxidoreductase n=1 Tax=Aurantimonas sp. C2-5-R2 TaxID=3113713 RepID=UPI002F93A7B5
MRYLPSFRLDGRNAIITGASRGLGRHIALALAEAGADVALVGRILDDLEPVAREVRDMGRQAVVLAEDLTDETAGTRIAQTASEVLGGIDILVNNAGTNIQQTALDVTHEVWDAIMDLNLRGAFFMAQAVAREMVGQGRGGRIINMASQMAEVGFYKRSAYCASKSGMIGFTRAMAIELAPQDIRVNAIGPTFIDSPLAREMFKDKEIAAEVIKRLPIGRFGRMEEVAATVVFLASDGADLITGHHLLVDGGWTAW